MKPKHKILIQILILITAVITQIYFYFQFKAQIEDKDKFVFFIGFISFTTLAILSLIKEKDTEYLILNRPYLEPILSYDIIEEKAYISFLIKNTGKYPIENATISYKSEYETKIDPTNKPLFIQNGSTIKINLLAVDISRLSLKSEPFKLQVCYESTIKGKKQYFSSSFKFPFINKVKSSDLINYYDSTFEEGKFNNESLQKEYKTEEILDNKTGSLIANFKISKQHKNALNLLLESENKKVFYNSSTNEVLFEWNFTESDILLNSCFLEFTEKDDQRIIIIEVNA